MIAWHNGCNKVSFGRINMLNLIISVFHLHFCSFLYNLISDHLCNYAFEMKRFQFYMNIFRITKLAITNWSKNLKFLLKYIKTEYHRLDSVFIHYLCHNKFHMVQSEYTFPFFLLYAYRATICIFLFFGQLNYCAHLNWIISKGSEKNI